MLVPDLISPLVGYRTWVMSPDGLISPMMFEKRPWAIDRAHVANCFLGDAFGRNHVEPHDSPDKECSCGIHSFSAFPKSWKKWAENETKLALKLDEGKGAWGWEEDQSLKTFVPGLVYSWGKVIEGDNGRRAEFAYPLALGFSPLWDSRKQKHVNQMALMYDVESMPIYELQEYAASK